MKMKNLNDEKVLVKSCLKGDIKAQQFFYERFASKMMGLCLRFTKSWEEAEDLLQEGFLKVYGDLSRYRGEGSLEGWVRKVILNVALQKVRKKQKMMQVDADLEFVTPPDNSHKQILQQFEIQSSYLYCLLILDYA